MSTLAATHLAAHQRETLLQSGCNFLMPITKCWFGISEFLWLAAVSDFFDNLLKEPAGAFPSLTIIKETSPSIHTHIQIYFRYTCTVLHLETRKIETLVNCDTRQDARVRCELILNCCCHCVFLHEADKMLEVLNNYNVQHSSTNYSLKTHHKVELTPLWNSVNNILGVCSLGRKRVF